MKPALAELIGTFTLVFIGAGTGAMAATSGGGLVAVALAHGLALMVIVYAWGSISGAHVNPAVTLGVAVSGRMEWPKAIVYWVAQFAGAAIAAYLLQWLLQGVLLKTDLGATIGSLTPTAANEGSGNAGKVIVVEAVLTFFLVVAVMVSGIHNRNTNLAGVAIGLVLAMDIFCGGPLTGASMNPARTFGPALADNDFSYLWMYIVGPAAGGAVAGVLMEKFFLAPDNGPKAAPPDARDKRRR